MLDDLRIGRSHLYQIALRIINLEYGAGIGNVFSGFSIRFYDFQVRLELRVVDEILVSFAVLCDIHHESGHQLPAVPSFRLLHYIFAIRQVLTLGKTVGVTNENIPFIGIGRIVASGRFQIHLKLGALFRHFDLRAATVRMLDNSYISFDYAFKHIVCGLVMLDCVKFRLGAYFVNGRIKQIALTRFKLPDRPIGITDIFFRSELPILVGKIFVNELVALENAVFRPGETSVALRCSGFGIAFGYGHDKLF